MTQSNKSKFRKHVEWADHYLPNMSDIVKSSSLKAVGLAVALSVTYWGGKIAYNNIVDAFSGTKQEITTKANDNITENTHDTKWDITKKADEILNDTTHAGSLSTLIKKYSDPNL